MSMRELIEAVERGEFDSKLAINAFGLGPAKRVEKAFNGSLDAALALHEAMLPGWDYVVGRTNGGLTAHAQLECETYFADTPARAWLLAILRAIEAKTK